MKLNFRKTQSEVSNQFGALKSRHCPNYKSFLPENYMNIIYPERDEETVDMFSIRGRRDNAYIHCVKFRLTATTIIAIPLCPNVLRVVNFYNTIAASAGIEFLLQLIRENPDFLPIIDVLLLTYCSDRSVYITDLPEHFLKLEEIVGIC